MERLQRLRRSYFPKGDEFGLDRHAFGDLDAQKSLKGFQFARIRDGETKKEFAHRIRTADVFNGALRAESGGAGNNENGTRGIETGDETDNGVILRERR